MAKLEIMETTYHFSIKEATIDIDWEVKTVTELNFYSEATDFKGHVENRSLIEYILDKISSDEYDEMCSEYLKSAEENAVREKAENKYIDTHPI